ncbi:MAG: 50S ribosomal protein L4 [Candidatus Ratteibacteria bacterium]
MKDIQILNLEGESVGKETIDLGDESIHTDLLHRYVTAFLANQRQGNADTKRRSEVSGSGRKPWRQKGTGRARVGEIRTPIWRHGGIVFGPHPRSYRQDLPKKMKERALQDALKSRILNDTLFLFEIGDNLTKPATSQFAAFIKKAGFSGKTLLFVVNKEDANRIAIIKSIRNIPCADYCYADQLSPYSILRNEILVAQREIFNCLKNTVGVSNE